MREQMCSQQVKRTTMHQPSLSAESCCIMQEMLTTLPRDCSASLTHSFWQLLQMDNPRDGCTLEVADPHPLQLVTVWVRL